MIWGDPNDPTRKWKEDADRAEEERRAAKRELRRSEEHNTVAHLRADMQHEIANLRTEMNRLHELQLAAVGQALDEISNKICERAEKAVDKIESELRILTERRFGEAMGRLDAIAPDARGNARLKDFKFSNERDEGGVIDLPNPLAPLVRKVTMN